MWVVLLALQAFAEEPFDPLDPFAGAPRPAVAAPNPALVDPVLDELDADITRWSAEAAAAGEALRESLAAWMSDRGEGAEVSRRATLLGVVLQVLAARERLARARLHELGIHLDPGRAERLLAANRTVVEAVREGTEPLVAARLRRIDALVRAQQVPEAMTEAEALVARLDELQRVTGPEPRLDEARLTLMELAIVLGSPSRTEQWAASCRSWCTPEGQAAGAILAERARTRVEGQRDAGIDPLADLGDGAPVTGDGPAPEVALAPRVPVRHRGWAALGVVPPIGAGRYGDVPVTRLASGFVDVGFAPTELACVSARWAIDRYSVVLSDVVDVADSRFDITRQRVELGYCPWLGEWSGRHLTVGLRPVGGIGVSFGRVDRYAAGGPLVGAGVHVRLEAPITHRWFTVVPSLGAAPYGRRSVWGAAGERQPYPFMGRVFGGIAVGVGIR